MSNEQHEGEIAPGVHVALDADIFPHEVEATVDFTPGNERFETTISGVKVEIVRVGTLDGQPWFEECHGVSRRGEIVGLHQFQSRCGVLFSRAMGDARRSASHE